MMRRSTAIPEALVLGAFFTSGSYLLALHAHWVETINWLEVFAVFTSYVSTWLCVRQRRLNYPFGAVSSAAYALLFWQSGLLASALLNAYLAPALVYGWIRWRQDSNARVVSRVRLRWWPVYLGATAAAYCGAAWLSGAIGGQMAWTDSIILTVTVLAQFLLDNKKLETWAFWAIVNVFAIFTYSHQGLYLVAAQYILFLLNTGIGYYAWKRSYDKGFRIADGHATNYGTPQPDSVR